MKTWFTLTNAAEAAEIRIFDEIGGWGILAKDFGAALDAIPKDKPLTVGINSPGGDVFEGIAIANLLRERGNVTTRIDGLAASIASIVAIAGQRVVMAPGAMMMIHDPTGIMVGSAEDARKLADTLDSIRDTLAALYADKTGKNLEEIQAAMAEETWFNAAQALDWGLVDEVLDRPKAQVLETWDLRGRYRRAPLAVFGFQNGRLSIVNYDLPEPDNTPAPQAQPEPLMNDLLKALKEGNILSSAELAEADAIAELKSWLADTNAAMTLAKTELEAAMARADELKRDVAILQERLAKGAVQAAVDAGKLKADAAPAMIELYLADEDRAQAVLDALEAPKPPPAAVAAVDLAPAAGEDPIKALSPGERYAMLAAIEDPIKQREFWLTHCKQR